MNLEVTHLAYGEARIETIKNTDWWNFATVCGYIGIQVGYIIKVEVIPDTEKVEYEFDMYFSPEDHDGTCPIEGWLPIAMDRIKEPHRIPEYLTSGKLREHVPNN